MHFKLQSLRNDEALITCPLCGKVKLYFNLNKKVGTCHYANCRFHSEAVTVPKLSSICGFLPEEGVTFIVPPYLQTYVLPPPTPITLPNEAEPLLVRKNGTYLTMFPIAIKNIISRGLVTEDMYRYNLHFDGLRVYIPVYDKGKLVQYVGRDAWWFETGEDRKYKYAPDVSVTNYLFNWDKNKHVKELTLVENTFVSIVLDGCGDTHMGTSSTFGSHLSDRQCDLIGTGAASSVVIVFDRDATEKAEKAVQKLRGLGVRAGMIILSRPQPDDYSNSTIHQSCRLVHGMISQGYVGKYEGQWAFTLNSEGTLII